MSRTYEMSRKNQKNIEKKKGENVMKKLGTGFATVLFFAVIVLSANVFAETVQSSSGLYAGGFMNEVLTRGNPSPWNVVRHYVGNNPKLIVQILKEQNISLNPAMKYPVGMAVKIPQKYVLKEFLPTPSQAEVAIKDAEHQAESQKQANEFFALLKSKDSSLATSYGFIVLLALALFAAVMAARNWHNKFVGAEATANVFEEKLHTVLIEKCALAQEKKVVSELWQSADSEKIRHASQIVKMGEMLAGKDKIITELLAQTPGQYVFPKDHSGKEHKFLISWTGWDEKTKTNDVWLQCPYCDLDAKNILGHISGSHPERISPDSKIKKPSGQARNSGVGISDSVG